MKVGVHLIYDQFEIPYLLSTRAWIVAWSFPLLDLAIGCPLIYPGSFALFVYSLVGDQRGDDDLVLLGFHREGTRHARSH